MISFNQYKRKQSIMENVANFAPKINQFLKEVSLAKNDTDFPVDHKTIDWFIEETKKYFFSNEENSFSNVKKQTKTYRKNSLSAEQRMEQLTGLFIKVKNNLQSYGSIEYIYNIIKKHIKEMQDMGASTNEIIFYLTDPKYSSKFKSTTDWNEFVQTIKTLTHDITSNTLTSERTMAVFFNNFNVLMFNLPSNLDFKTLSEIQSYFLEKFSSIKGQKYIFNDGSIWSENNFIRTNYSNGVISAAS